MSAARLAGSIEALRRYPVKSMAGEALSDVRVLADHGLQGDRAFAVLDVETGRVASAKHPRRWGALLDCRASTLDTLVDAQRHGRVAIALPDTTTVCSDQDQVDRIVSSALGRAVRLVASPPRQARYDERAAGSADARGVPLAVGAGAGTFFDVAPIHLVTTASLARLRELRPASGFEIERFRPNLVIDTACGSGFVENDWLGQIVAIGDHVRLCVTFLCPRCVMPTLAQGALTADAEVLRTVAAHNMQMFPLLARRMPTLGAYATVVRGGTIRLGDPVRLEGRAPLQRAAAFMHAIKRAMRRR